MNEKIGRFQKQIERLLADGEENNGVMETQSGKVIDEVFKWLLRNILPILICALTINLFIMFTIPVGATMSKWFWLKDLLSIIIGYVIVRTNRHRFNNFI